MTFIQLMSQDLNPVRKPPLSAKCLPALLEVLDVKRKPLCESLVFFFQKISVAQIQSQLASHSLENTAKSPFLRAFHWLFKHSHASQSTQQGIVFGRNTKR